MTPPPDLEKALAATRAVLKGHVRSSPEVIARVSGLDRAVIARLAPIDEGGLDPAWRTFLRRLRRSFSDWRDLEPEARLARLRRILDALDRGPKQKDAPARPGVEALGADRPAGPSVRSLKGVGPVLGDALFAAGISTVDDLLHTLPRDWRDRRSATPVRDLKDGDEAIVIGEVQALRKGRRRGQLDVVVGDGTGRILLCWFRTPAWIPTRAAVGTQVVATGKVSRRGELLQLVHPELDLVGEGEGHRGGIIPLYPAILGVGTRSLRTLVRRAFDQHQVEDVIPAEVLSDLGLLSRSVALAAIHFPEDPGELSALRDGSHPAHRALLGRDLLTLQLALAQRWAGAATSGTVYSGQALRTRAVEALPFALTDGQRSVMAEIDGDLGSGRVMRRLVLGDVGSGKTVLALLAALPVLQGGARVAVLAPTEVLARQWELRARDLLGPLGVPVDLLVGGQQAAPRRELRARLAGVSPGLVVGTHALVQEGVQLTGLGLVIIDEQQRFGVGERARLTEKGQEPHLLAITATPIPRTLALALYGDLDLSLLPDREDRPGITTGVFGMGRLREVWEALRQDVEADGRALVIVPRIEGQGENQGVVDLAEELANGPLLGVPLAVVHGGLSGVDKERALAALRSGAARVLVGTTVLEVGIDVTDATLVVILEAERFGLSQLHQIRGRVGRGDRPGRCLLVHGTPDAPDRLRVLREARNGFEIAEADLRLRGAGDLVGRRQAGTPAFRLMMSPGYGELLERCRRVARRVVLDPQWVEDPRWRVLREEATRRLEVATEGNTS